MYVLHAFEPTSWRPTSTDEGWSDARLLDRSKAGLVKELLKNVDWLQVAARAAIGAGGIERAALVRA